ncbi:hypothetical protein VB773_12780 [Haloarculaceae archaeon H-GB2-1]|nr:hypothetical protein [Haloarculaceae archaeon H-GB1-1]MEA5386871.1 hypothetical protein [Haloarculaceae archaeon H-GB11]MEA5408347.1 hypothetical protein [Haloarculaceae archaeon H-GB2-1]
MSQDDTRAKIYESVVSNLDQTKHHQINSWDRLDTKASQIISADLILAGLALSTTTAIESIHFRIFVLAALGVLTVSIVCCSRAIVPGTVAYGLGEGATRRAEQIDDIETLNYDLMRATESAIVHNRAETASKSYWLGAGIWAAIAGLLFLLVAVLSLSVPITYEPVWNLVAIVVVLLALLAYYFYTRAKQK